MLKAVFDTNVLVSAFISPKGPPAKLIKFLVREKFIHVLSSSIEQELSRVLNYSRIKETYSLTDEEIKKNLFLLSLSSLVVEPKMKLDVVKKDPSDNIFLEAAVAGKADFIVSGDKHLLDIGEYKGIKILTPKQFLSYLKNQ